jgi:hypothetical protein
MERKIVWRFTKYDIETDKRPESSRYATLSCIERVIKGEAVRDSLRHVDAAFVDARGFYIGPPLGDVGSFPPV